VDLERSVADDDLIYKGPEQALTAVHREVVEAPEGECAEPRHARLVSFLCLHDERALLRMG